MPDVVLQVLNWVDLQGRTPQLIEGLSREFPDDPGLRRFHSPGAGRLSTHVIEGLIGGSRPFINRLELRNWVRQLDQRRLPVLVVNGFRGSGKSYTVAFLQHVAWQTEKFDLMSVQLHSRERLSVLEFARAIATSAGWNPQSLPTSELTTSNRYIKELANWLAAQAQSRRKPLMIAVDDLDDKSLNPDIVAYIQEVMRVCTRTRKLLLVLLGFPPQQIPIDCAPFVKKEEIQPLTPTDVEHFLIQLVSAGVLPGHELVGVKDKLFSALPRAAGDPKSCSARNSFQLD